MVEGERVLGRFTVGERLGGGGHGTVHRAWDERLCRRVAVKEVSGTAAERVLREAHAAARLNHPGIVTLYELGHEAGRAYLVSELVEGPNMRELAARGALSDREVAELGAELCAALEHAHDAGVVHRDLKPDNVLVRAPAGRFSRGPGERALLADFGIAALADATALTATGQVVGTLAYMSPEQAAGEDAGPPSDVYSLGLTLYELWAGFNPVAGATPAATARAIGAPVPPLHEIRPELPPALGAVLGACLRPEPELRPALPALREALLELRGTLHPERPVPEPAVPEPAATLPPGVPARPFAVLLGAGVLALLGALAGVPGLAIVVAALLAPALALLRRPREWVAGALAPLLGILGAAPAFLALAANHPRPGARAALALLGWAWTGIVGALVGRSLGVPLADPPASPAGWAASGPVTADALLAPLLDPAALALALIWVAGALLLGVLLDIAAPAGAALGGLLWAAGIAALIGAADPAGASAALLAPALLIAVGLAIWDRNGRPDPRVALARGAARTAARGPGAPASATARAPARPRNLAPPPLPDGRVRATRTASRHVRAALHEAGSRASVP